MTTPENILRIISVGTAAYIGLMIVLHLGGKRTLSKFSAFDFVVTIAFGSTFAAAITDKTLTLPEALVAFALLAALQYVAARLNVRYETFRRRARARPRRLLYEGACLECAMRDERVTHADILAAVRAQGHGDLSAIHAVILERDGSLSAIPRNRAGDGSALADVPDDKG